MTRRFQERKSSLKVTMAKRIHRREEKQLGFEGGIGAVRIGWAEETGLMSNMVQRVIVLVVVIPGTSHKSSLFLLM